MSAALQGVWHHSPECSRPGMELIFDADGYLVADVGSFHRADAENKALARRIEALPDALEALDNLVTHIESKDGDMAMLRHFVAEGRKALNKALGDE